MGQPAVWTVRLYCNTVLFLLEKRELGRELGNEERGRMSIEEMILISIDHRSSTVEINKIK